jgi:mono/diheme cytochrome c family protein
MPRILFAFVALILVCGCGNQMMRQPSFRALDLPRAEPPAGSVPYQAVSEQWDSSPIHSAAFGNNALDNGALNGSLSDAKLPPPDLSDNSVNDAVPASVDRLQNPLVKSTYVIQVGHTVFLNRCVQCHSPTGYGYGPVGGYLSPEPPNLADPRVQRRTEGALYWQITAGSGKMPGVGRWTTSEQRWALVDYVKSIKSAQWTHTGTADASYPVYGVRGFEDGFIAGSHGVHGDGN